MAVEGSFKKYLRNQVRISVIIIDVLIAAIIHIATILIG